MCIFLSSRCRRSNGRNVRPEKVITGPTDSPSDSGGVRDSGGVGDNGSRKVSTDSAPPTPRRIEEEILQSSILRRFCFDDLKMATGNFRHDRVLGMGGFGCVFKGWIDEHKFTPAKAGISKAIAVKCLNENSFQGHDEWLAEVNYLGQFQHPNLVKLVGYCLEDERRLLVYEFMPKGSLDGHLFGKVANYHPLPWNLRMKVALGAARGLAFLHDAQRKVIYRDLKTSNVLLDSNYNAKLSDFGLARDGPAGDDSHVTTRIIGTSGYAAPEYVATGHLSVRSDVYSYGIVLLEMLTGRRALERRRPACERQILEWVRPYVNNKYKIFRILDTRLGGQFSRRGARRAVALALCCVASDPWRRPTMVEVVNVLEHLLDKDGGGVILQSSRNRNATINRPPQWKP